MDDHGLLFNVFVYLTAAVVAVPIASLLGLGSVLGYLLAGVVIGPWVLQLIADPEEILHFAEFGVVLLLFLIGLELNPKRLWSLRKPILGMGGGQVIVTALLLMGVGLALGVGLNTAMIAAMGLALSSTAIALQILGERDLLGSGAGQSGFAILLFQDIAVIPMLALIPLLGVAEIQPDAAATPGWLAVLKVLGVIAAIVVGGRFLIRPVFRVIARTGMREMFIAFSLLLVIAVAMLMQAVDMSMALGAFIAGVLLAESEYRHELEIDIEPFKGLLMGLFFIAVGMSIDFGLLWQMPFTIAGLAIGLVAVKVAVLWLIARIFAVNADQHLLLAFLLSQGGEFAFVLFGVATAAAVIPESTAAILVVVVALSMVTTPLLLILNDKVLQPRFTRLGNPAYDEIADNDNPVIIAGYGRFGQIVGRLLTANQIPVTIIDRDVDQIELLRRFGWKVYYGDASRIDLLHAAGAQQARLLVIAVDNSETMLAMVDLVQRHFPKLPIAARVRNRSYAYQLLDRGVEVFERETFDAALKLGEQALLQLGWDGSRATQATRLFYDHDLESLKKLYRVSRDSDEEQLITASKQSRADLERLFTEERGERPDDDDDGLANKAQT